MKIKYAINPSFDVLGLTSSVIAEVHGLSVVETPPDLNSEKSAAAERLRREEDVNISNNPILESYRGLVRSIGRSPRKFPPAAEKLIKQVRRVGHFPTINAAVDAYNLVVAKSYLALGVHDIDLLSKVINFRLSLGGEDFRPVGGDSEKLTQSGDYVYADEQRVLAWLDSSDSDQVKISESTKNLVVVIQGTAFTTLDYNIKFAEEACRSIVRFCGGSFEVRTLRDVASIM